MSKTWYVTLGFPHNPFSIKPAALSDEIVGHHIEPVLDRINEGSMQYIQAPLGSGKTTILKGIINRFGGQKKVAYTNCIKNECIRLKQLLQGASFTGRLTGAMPKNMILLVDEAQVLSAEDANDIDYQVSKGRIKSVVFFGTDYVPENLTENIQSALKNNVVHLPYLTPDQAIELIKKRVGTLKLLPDYVIRDLYARSGGNPRRLLQLCEDVSRQAVKMELDELTVKDLDKMLKKAPKGEPSLVEKPKKVEPKKDTHHEKHVEKKNDKNGDVVITEIKDPDIGKTGEVSYSGFDAENIRTYEEEWGTPDDALLETDRK